MAQVRGRVSRILDDDRGWELIDDPLQTYLADVYTVTANLAGLPALSLPCGFSGSLPVGLQLIGRPLDEATVLRAGDAYQRHTDFHERVPPEVAR